MDLKQVFESDRIRYVEVSEALIPDYLAMVNDFEHVNRFIGGLSGPYTEEMEISCGCGRNWRRRPSSFP